MVLLKVAIDRLLPQALLSRDDIFFQDIYLPRTRYVFRTKPNSWL
jgi:hypothetical protein